MAGRYGFVALSQEMRRLPWPCARDLSQSKLRSGDIATVVKHHPGGAGQEPGFTLEVFNVVGLSPLGGEEGDRQGGAILGKPMSS